jgi:hypothetical protein
LRDKMRKGEREGEREGGRQGCRPASTPLKQPAGLGTNPAQTLAWHCPQTTRL